MTSIAPDNVAGFIEFQVFETEPKALPTKFIRVYHSMYRLLASSTPVTLWYHTLLNDKFQLSQLSVGAGVSTWGTWRNARARHMRPMIMRKRIVIINIHTVSRLLLENIRLDVLDPLRMLLHYSRHEFTFNLDLADIFFGQGQPIFHILCNQYHLKGPS